MLTPKPQLNLQHAREYFREHLCAGDYYSAGQKVTGEWFGLGAEKMALKGAVNEAQFLRLCEGSHPHTGDRLTQRKNETRQNEAGQNVANRRVFYDFTISPPKSVSVVGLLQDVRILELHQQAVSKAMIELEKLAETRVRKSGQNTDRQTGNILGATFRHDTSRELDPHLHTHCVVFNATFDPVENRWKALEAGAMYKAQRFVENCYFHELAKGLRGLGYELSNDKRAFRIHGVPESLTARFSKRHQEIDRETARRVELGWRGNLKDLREQVSRDIRKRKPKDATAERLRPEWRSQLQPDEVAALAKLSVISNLGPGLSAKADVVGIVAWADEHLFERRSVVAEHELLAAALERGRGESFDLAQLRTAIEQREYVREKTTNRLTSREVLRVELAIVIAAKDGQFRHTAFNSGYQPSEKLSPEQKTAVGQILGSRDFITLFRGGAGTGKSFTLKEVQRGLVAAGRSVVVLAPQRQQASDLQADGLPAETLSRFLVTKQLAKDAVVIVDEAGQIGGRQLHELICAVKARGGRLILSGDTRQHGAVPASDALRAIEKHAGLKPAVIGTIRRQDPALGKSAREREFIHDYRSAVKAAAKGKIIESFDRLNTLGCIRENVGTEDERRNELAREYLAALERKERVLVVAQTRDEVHAVNETIRQHLRAQGKLGADTTIMAHQPVDMGEAQKRDPRFYSSGQHAFFLRAYGRYAKGDHCEIIEVTDRGLVILKDGRRSTLSYRYTTRIAVTAAAEMSVAPGDRLQLKFNGKSLEGAPLNNGELVTVQQTRPDGALVVEDAAGARKTLSPTQRVFVRGYAVTSYGSQGKTVDTVLMADAATAAATNANQWYVSISRARKKVVIFTSDKTALRERIQRSGDRDLALELEPQNPKEALDLSWTRRALEAAEHQRRHQAVMARTSPQPHAHRFSL